MDSFLSLFSYLEWLFSYRPSLKDSVDWFYLNDALFLFGLFSDVGEISNVWFQLIGCCIDQLGVKQEVGCGS